MQSRYPWTPRSKRLGEADKALIYVALSLQLDAVRGDPKALVDLEFGQKLYRAFLKRVKEVLGTKEGKALLGSLAESSVLDTTAKLPSLIPSIAKSVKDWFRSNVGDPIVQAAKNTIATAIGKAWLSGGAKIVATAANPIIPHPTFNLQDAQALANLTNHTMYWVKEAGVRNIDTRIATIVQDGLAKGYGRKEIAAMLEQRLGSFHQVDSARWGVVASAATNRARTYGQITEFQTLHVPATQFSAVSDERTCPICSAFNGKIYATEDVSAVMQRGLSATTPEEFIDAQPWIGLGSEGMYVKRSGGDRIPITPDTAVEYGACNPPLHGHCRCELLPYLETMEVAVERAEQSRQDREEWKAPQDIAGVPLTDKIGAKGPAMGWHTGEIERSLLPGAKEAPLFEASTEYKATPKGWTAKARWLSDGKEAVTTALHHTGFSLEASVGGSVRVPATVVDRIATQMAEAAKAHKLPVTLTVKAGLSEPRATLGALRQGRLAGGMRASFQRWAISEGHGAELANQSIGQLLQSGRNGQTLIEKWLGTEWSGEPWQIYL